MRLNHSDIESCSSNPSIWARTRLASKNSNFRRRGYDGFTKLAIFAFHKTLNEASAFAKLSGYLSSFKSLERIHAAEDILTQYISWYRHEKPIVVDTCVRINLSIGLGNTLGGEISRVDLVHQKGYRGILIGHIPARWEMELRMPLIQVGLANYYDRDPSEVAVGWQALTGGAVITKTYPEKEINQALKRITQISKVIHDEEIAHALSK